MGRFRVVKIASWKSCRHYLPIDCRTADGYFHIVLVLVYNQDVMTTCQGGGRLLCRIF